MNNYLNMEDIYICSNKDAYIYRLINLKHVFISVGLDLTQNNQYCVRRHKKYFEDKLKNDYNFIVQDQFRNQILRTYYSTIESLNKRKL